MNISEHTSQLGRWRTVQRPADPRLRAHVRGYFASSSHISTPVREHHLPSTEVPLLLNFGAPHRRRDKENCDRWSALDRAWVVGLQSSHQVTEAAGERHFMVVRFTPIGANLFLGLPMHLIANQALALDLIEPALARLIMSRVAAQKTWAGRFAAMDALIAERIANANPSRPVDFVWQRLAAAGGRVALGPLASELELSKRTLIAHFRSCVGFPPKTIARIMRFNRAVDSFHRLARTRADVSAGKPYLEAREGQAGPARAVPWADIASDCGYFDQAHFIRDFREFAGHTPTAFLRGLSHLN